MRRIAIVLGSAAVLVLATALPAAAHIKIEPPDAERGGDTVLSFVVPNEMGNASTVKVQVKFPDDHPIADALTEPVPGWTAEVKTKPVTTKIHTDAGDVSEAVDTVTWTASDNKGYGKGEFQEFKVSVGLPAAGDVLDFPTLQTYSNGQVVSWVQATPPGGPEPDVPRPELKLVAPASDSATATTAPATGGGGSAVAASNVKKSDVDSAKTLAIIALIVGAVGLLAGIGGFAMGRRRTT
ncbi:MAG TPA: YcnI family protein [Acidimicrobiia bacterium]|nr:YcnI family protein [Acidimicrobiia bacterium]